MIELNKKLNIISILIIILSIIVNIYTSLSILPYRSTLDDFQHFYDMHRWYEKEIIPYTGTRFELTDTYKSEFTTPRVPGGIYYITYTLFYKIANENLYVAKIINYIFSLSIILIFLFWLFKRFGLIITSFMSVLVLCNGYVIRALTLFWNPNLALIFSFIFFIFFIFLFEYICNDSELKTKLSAIFMFPALAIMAQAHFSVFFSIVPTVIIYLIIKYKKTFKYLPYFAIGVFISFLLYLPYLVYEIKNHFYNTYSMLEKKSSISNIGFPQYQAFILFPTNEMSATYMRNLDNILNFWFSEPAFIFGFIFLLLSLIFSAICLIGSFYILFNKKYNLNNIESTIKEIFKILLLSMIVSTIFFLIAPPSSSSFHYLYGIFAMSYSYILLFIVKYKNIIINKKNILYTLLIFLILNTFAMSLTVKRYINKYELENSIHMNNQINDYINQN